MGEVVAPTHDDVPGERRLSISVVTIGKNEEANLGVMFSSLGSLPNVSEVIYVDSASEDRSVEVALVHGARVARLLPSPNLSAAAGRYVGTLLAQGDWILYLDGDMQLTPEFAGRIPELLKAAVEAPEVAGYVGFYENQNADGTRRCNVLRQRRGRLNAGTFGGAVLASRTAVLGVGNWDPCLSAHEELDLHSRLAAAGLAIRFVPTRMVIHRTEAPRPLRLLLHMFLPFRSKDRRLLGIGQLVRSRMHSHSLWGLISFYPHPFILMALAALAVGTACAPYPGVLCALGVVGVAIVYAATRTGLKSIPVFLSYPLRIVLGAARCSCGWKPEHEIVSARRCGRG